ncbi:MAG: tetraacyldisaccharide 4'-kinase [Candidatus Binatia bacterium]
MKRLQQVIETVWQRQSLWSKIGWAALVPLSLGFSCAVRGRNLLYDTGLLPITQVDLNVISVGNLTVGGSGKTPLTLWLAQEFQRKGYRTGVLTRGYKGTATGITVVGKNGTPLATIAEVGDEAVLLARRFAGVVLAGRDRSAAALMAQQQFDLQVVILDDGFQHRRLPRDVDILLVTAQQLRNTWLLPAGPLREPISSARRANLIVYTKSERRSSDSPIDPLAQVPLSPVPRFYGDFVPTALIQSVHGNWQELPLALLAGKRVTTITGIATPAPFFDTVRQQGATVAKVMEFPDHHRYTNRDWQEIRQESQAHGLVVTTEKDLVKLEQFPPLSTQLVALRGEMRIDPTEPFFFAIEQRFRYKHGDRTKHGRTVSH